MNLNDTVDYRDIGIDPPSGSSTTDFDLNNSYDVRDLPQAIPSMVNNIQRDVFVGNTGIGNSQFDRNIPLSQLENLGSIRAMKQPGSHQIVHALIGGIGGGLMTAVETAGYLLDIENNINRLKGVEDVESNFVSEWAKNNKEALFETLPIYRKRPDQTFDFKDSGFYWEAFRGILDSAVGFGGVGLGVGLGVKATGAALRASRLGAWSNAIGNSLAQGQTGNVTAAYLTNFAESKMMGLELYEDTFNKSLESLVSDYQVKNGTEPTEEELNKLQLEASDIAGKHANDFMLRNKIFTVIEHSQLKSIFKSTSPTSRIIDKPGTLSFLKSQAVNAPKEAAEEIGQNVLQMEGQYQAEQDLIDRNIIVEDPISTTANFGERLIEFATSDQALLEGMMGLFSGPIQYTVTGLPFRNKEAESKLYTDQQATIAKNEDFLKAKMATVADRAKAAEELTENGEGDLAEIYKLQEFDNLAIENFKQGTTQNLYDLLQEELNNPEYTEEERSNIESKIQRLQEFEQEFVKYRKYSNAEDVLSNRMQLRLLNDTLSTLDSKNNDLESTIRNTFTNRVNAYNKRAKEPISVDQIIEAIVENDFSNLPKNVATEVQNNPDVQTMIGINKSSEDIANAIADINTVYNHITNPKYQTAYENFNNIVLNNELTTEEKITELSNLEKNASKVNSTFKKLIESTRSSLENYVEQSKESKEVKPEPEQKEAQITKDNSKPVQPSNRSSVGLFGEPEQGEFNVDDIIPAEDESPQLQAELQEIKKGKIADALINNDSDEAQRIATLDPSIFREELEADPEVLEQARRSYLELQDLPDTMKDQISTFVENSGVTFEIRENPTASNEVTSGVNPKAEIEEAQSYNSVSTEIVNDLVEYEGSVETKGTDIHPKIVMNHSNQDFVDWATQGISHKGKQVQYILNDTKFADSRAREIFNRKKTGQTISDVDEKYMVDNLGISVTIPDAPGIITNLYVVRPKGDQIAAEAERDLRRSIINNLLQDQPAFGTIQGQYGGDLYMSEADDVSIVNIPDFRNKNVQDIEFMYVNGEGYLNDADTRQPTKHNKFLKTQVLLKANKKPMAGALFVTVNKANGDIFPLKVNIRNFTDNEVRAVGNLLIDIAKPQSAEDKTNTLNKTVPETILNLLSQEDRDFLGKSPKYKDVLSFLVYEGDRSKSNPITQLLVKNSKIIFGDNTLNVKDPVDMTEKLPLLREFLNTYKTRSVDLRRLQSDKRYKAHIINSGIITTNANITNSNSLFTATNLTQTYKDVNDRIANRFRSATLYVNKNLANPQQDFKVNQTSNTQKSSKVLDVNKKQSNLQVSPDVVNNTTRNQKQSEEIVNKVNNMNLPNPIKQNNIDVNANKARMNKLANKLVANINKKVNENKEENKDNCKGNN